MEPSGSDRGLKASEMGAFAEEEPRSRTVSGHRPYSDSVTDNAKKQQSPAKPYKERIDPGGEFGKQTTGLAALAASPIGRVLRWLGVDQATLDQTKELEETYRRLTEEPDRISAALAPLGWIFFELAPFDDYVAAATLAEQGKVAEAEELLTQSYNDNDHVHLRFFHRVWSLYQGDERREGIGLARQRLLQEAFELHKEGRYAAAIPLVLAQIDGIFIDMTGKPAKYFFNPDNPNLVDEVTLAGHPFGLKALSKLMSEEARKTVLSDRLTRQGILHGRVLAYDTLHNSTKSFVALLAVIEAVRPRADELSKKAAGERERRYAGSKEVDEWGRRRDRRGFDEAKKTLLDVQLYQHGLFIHRARYAPDRAALDAWQPRLKDANFELRAGDDGQEFWAWAETASGVVFGLAMRGGEYTSWLYVDDEPPAGGIDADERWQHVTEAAFPDW
jgi:hypothetical protein